MRKKALLQELENAYAAVRQLEQENRKLRGRIVTAISLARYREMIWKRLKAWTEGRSQRPDSFLEELEQANSFAEEAMETWMEKYLERPQA